MILNEANPDFSTFVQYHFDSLISLIIVLITVISFQSFVFLIFISPIWRKFAILDSFSKRAFLAVKNNRLLRDIAPVFVFLFFVGSAYFFPYLVPLKNAITTSMNLLGTPTPNPLTGHIEQLKYAWYKTKSDDNYLVVDMRKLSVVTIDKRTISKINSYIDYLSKPSEVQLKDSNKSLECSSQQFYEQPSTLNLIVSDIFLENLFSPLKTNQSFSYSAYNIPFNLLPKLML